jgi:acetyl-CoA acetyltransferase
MPRAVVLSAVRTPVGRYGGGLAGERPDDLAAIALRAAVERAGIDPTEIDDVYLGCANQAGEDNRNVARMAVLLAGLPETVPGATVNRLCASGLFAIVSACRAIAAGEGDVFVAGGVESMTRAPLAMMKGGTPWSRGNVVAYDTGSRTRGSRPSSRWRRWARPGRTSRSAGTCRARPRTRSPTARSSAGPRRRLQEGSPTSSCPSAS